MRNIPIVTKNLLIVNIVAFLIHIYWERTLQVVMY